MSTNSENWATYKMIKAEINQTEPEPEYTTAPYIGKNVDTRRPKRQLPQPTAAQIQYIRSHVFEPGEKSILARELGVSPSAISRVLSGKVK